MKKIPVLLIALLLYRFIALSPVFAQTSPITIEGPNSPISGEIIANSEEEIRNPVPSNNPHPGILGLTDPRPANNNTGTFTLSKLNFPNFKAISFALSKSLANLLPAKRSQTLSLPDTAKTLQFNSFAIPGVKNGSSWTYNASDPQVTSGCTEDINSVTAQEDATLPEFWGELVGANKGLLHLTPTKRLTNEAKYLVDFSYQLPDTIRTCKLNLYSPGPNAKPEPLVNIDRIKPGFTVLGLLTYWFSDLLDNLGNIVGGNYEKSVKIVPVADLPAGEAVANDSANVGGGFTTSKRMSELKPKDKDEVLTVSKNDQGLVGEVALSPGQSNNGDLMLAKQAKTRNYNCAALCSAYSEKRVKEGQYWVGPNTLCPSCDAKDYEK